MNHPDLHLMTMRLERGVRDAQLERQARLQEQPDLQPVQRLRLTLPRLVSRSETRLTSLPRLTARRRTEPATA